MEILYYLKTMNILLYLFHDYLQIKYFFQYHYRVVKFVISSISFFIKQYYLHMGLLFYPIYKRDQISVSNIFIFNIYYLSLYSTDFCFLIIFSLFSVLLKSIFLNSSNSRSQIIHRQV